MQVSLRQVFYLMNWLCVERRVQGAGSFVQTRFLLNRFPLRKLSIVGQAVLPSWVQESNAAFMTPALRQEEPKHTVYKTGFVPAKPLKRWERDARMAGTG